MLRNSFSSENLIKIFYNENRKGNFVEGKYFPSLNTYTRKITDINPLLPHDCIVWFNELL